MIILEDLKRIAEIEFSQCNKGLWCFVNYGMQKMLKLELLERYLYSSIIKNGKVKYLNRKRLACIINDDIMLLTVKARYGKDFSREGEKNEIRI